jgi:putative PEP-CTERM system histidine kinase
LKPGLESNLEINLTQGFVSYIASGLLYLFLLAIYFVGSTQGRVSKPFVLLLVATLIWSSLLTLSQIGASIAFEMVTVAELMRYFTWFYILHTAAGYYLEGNARYTRSNPLTPKNIGVIFVIAIVGLVTNKLWAPLLALDSPLLIQVGWMLGFSILGLLLVEQVIRNTPATGRGTIALLCISAGAIFAYDFFVFSNAMLTRSIDYELWSTRGVVNILVLPTLVLAAVRNPEMAPNLHISRKFVFHSTTLLGAGAYLIVMAFIGYYARQTSAEWGKLIQTSFLFGALLLLVVLFYSPKFKTRIRRFLNLSFRNKYDYRDEWNRFSQTLLIPNPDVSIYQRAIQAIGQIVESHSGSLWIRDNAQYIHKAGWNTQAGSQPPVPESNELIRHIMARRQPFQGNFAAPDTDIEKNWLILPLWVNDELFGFVRLAPPIVPLELDIEDIDLLDTVAHHVSLALFLKEADIQLQQAQQFKGLNQMTAFLVHDMKTVFSQLSLLVENASTHKRNPEFIDDMIDTVDHTTQKMQRLLEQLRNPEKKATSMKLALIPVVEEIVMSYRNQLTDVSLHSDFEKAPMVNGDPQQLTSAIKHIVQNGVESAGKDGRVELSLQHCDEDSVELVIEDNGAGMAPEFISNNLFKPFESTKGVSGMGVGVYQSREYLRSIAGELQVSSEQGVGTRFKISLPVDYE